MKQLVEKACRGDGNAFADAIIQVQSSLYRVARSYLSDKEDIADAVQETILKAWKGITGLKEPKYFKTWIIRILMNECIRIQRQNKAEIPVDPEPDPGERTVIFRERVSERQEWQPGLGLEFEEMMHLLSPAVRSVMVLYYGEGYTTAEIAGLLNSSDDAVRKRLSRGRAEIKEKYLLRKVAE